MTINIIEIRLEDPNLLPAHDQLDQMLDEGWQIISHCQYLDGSSNVRQYPTERYTLYRESGSQQLPIDALHLTTIVEAERGETSNSASPMWRCKTSDGERVNIFKHDDPEKDNYHLFQSAGWHAVLNDIPLWATVDFHPAIQVLMQKNGKWWEIVKVGNRPESLIDVMAQLEAEGGDE